MSSNILALTKLRTSYPVFFELLSSVQPGKALQVSGLSGSLYSLLFASHFVETDTPVFFVAADHESAEEAANDFRQLLGPSGVRVFMGPAHPQKRNQTIAGGPEDIATIRALLNDAPTVTITHAGALGLSLPRQSDVKNRMITLKVGEECGLSGLLELLHMLGLEKKDFVETQGNFAVRGGIVDVFPFVGENPLRLEFLGETLESIREFDTLSQRSIRDLSEAALVANLLDNTGATDSLLFDHLPVSTIIVLDAFEVIGSTCEHQHERAPDRFASWDQVQKKLALFPQVHRSLLSTHIPEEINFGSTPQPSFNRSIKHLYSHLRGLQKAGFEIIVTCDTSSEQSRLKELLEGTTAQQNEDSTQGDLPSADDGSLDIHRIVFSLQSLSRGFVLPDARLAVFTEHQVFDRVKRRTASRRQRSRGFSDREVSRLKKGDYVVHEDYGIGRFEGLKKIHVSTIEQEALKLSYEDNDVLYVNLNYLGKLQKYSSKEGHVPRLTKLGRPDWEKMKARAKSRIKDIARDLIRLYAKRKSAPGHAFSADTPWQKELEASFMYEDTFDQAKATRDVKEDMEASYPMDRLVCGDVGFGKTEIAVRAAFKAVMNGKQVGVLVPTTILAMQHFNTFVDRTSPYSSKVEVLSRFRSRKDQLRILDELNAGSIDIVIGTHRLLSKDVIFKDLGLLVIDEEHRFGVAAKEKLRSLKAHVDTLTLTATPIPRTLHFSLMGARDLSIIATPPRNRLPVATEITRYNDELIREVILREVSREGQVYFVHDRITNIEDMTSRVRALHPRLRVRFAHGQMPAHELEEVMVEFLEKRFDVLVCTKIIESGLDIPNVNTIIINRADRFGLAELYQLRGRVGRSNTQAYAYLLVPPVETLPRETLSRLEAVEEFTELGSGFHLAMRDLEIRGAGNLLGGEQSGFIETMGFETYTRILDDAIQELKDEEFKEVFTEEKRTREPDTVVEVELNALLPEVYVENDNERLDIYRRLYSVGTHEQLEEIAEELKDRFGPFMPEVENLFGVVRLRLASSKIGFRKVRLSPGGVEIEFPPESDRSFYDSESFQLLMKRIAALKKYGVLLKNPASRLVVSARFDPAAEDSSPIDRAIRFLADLTEGIGA